MGHAASSSWSIAFTSAPANPADAAKFPSGAFLWPVVELIFARVARNRALEICFLGLSAPLNFHYSEKLRVGNQPKV
jgi:hypothetical protein